MENNQNKASTSFYIEDILTKQDGNKADTKINADEIDTSQNEIIITDNCEENTSEVTDFGLHKENEYVSLTIPQSLNEKQNTNLTDHISDEAIKVYPSTAPDEWSIYGQHVGNKLRKYNKQTGIMVQHLINSILFEADFGKYEVSSYSFVQPHNPRSPPPSTF